MTTFNGGSLGSCIDEERSELRYVMWIAEFSESSNLRTQMALQGPLCSMTVWVSVLYSLQSSVEVMEGAIYEALAAKKHLLFFFFKKKGK